MRTEAELRERIESFEQAKAQLLDPPLVVYLKEGQTP